MNQWPVPVLIVENDRAHLLLVQGRLQAAADRVGASVEIQIATEFQEARTLIQTGEFAAAIIDLHLPDDHAGADSEEGELVGLALIEEMHKSNSDTAIAVYTSHGKEAVDDLVGAKLDASLNKLKHSDKEIEDRLVGLLNEVLRRYNFSCDVRLETAIRCAFGDDESGKSNPRQWDLCLRRLFKEMKSDVSYQTIVRGRSGAGIVAAYVDEFLPWIIKLGSRKKLTDEAERYKQFVHNHIQRKAPTSSESLASVGERSALAYSYVGSNHRPETLGDLLRTSKPCDLRGMLERHFDDNCRNWFASSGVDKPRDLAGALRARLGLQKSLLKQLRESEHCKRAMAIAGTHLASNARRDFLKTVDWVVNDEWPDLLCQPFTIAHGDLNVGNLIYDGTELWMIDFGRTSDDCPRILDFIKLEASVKLLGDSSFAGLSEDDEIRQRIEREKRHLETFALPAGSESSLRDHAISAIRDCARRQCGRGDPAREYWQGLLFMMVRECAYLDADIARGESLFPSYVQAVFAVMRLADVVS